MITSNTSKTPLRHLQTIDDVSAEWLSQALGAEVTKFGFERIGTGQISFCYRSELEYADGANGPRSVALKLSSDDEKSLATARMMSFHRKEVNFYTQVAPELPRGTVPEAFFASYDKIDVSYRESTPKSLIRHPLWQHLILIAACCSSQMCSD
jgi:hypothetical protein